MKFNRGFDRCMWVGTSIVEANMSHKLATIMDSRLLLIFLGVWSAYNVLDRGSFMYILMGHGLCPRVLGIFLVYWPFQKIIPKVRG